MRAKDGSRQPSVGKLDPGAEREGLVLRSKSPAASSEFHGLAWGTSGLGRQLACLPAAMPQATGAVTSPLAYQRKRVCLPLRRGVPGAATPPVPCLAEVRHGWLLPPATCRTPDVRRPLAALHRFCCVVGNLAGRASQRGDPDPRGTTMMGGVSLMLPSIAVLRGVVEEGGQRVELLLRERIELVIVADGAAGGQAEPDLAGGLGAVAGVEHEVLLVDRAAFVGRDVAAVEAGGDALIERAVRAAGRRRVARW